MAIAVVTGAGRGIGRAVAQALAADGWQVAACARNPADAAETLADYPDGLAVRLDVTDRESVRAAFETVAEHYGRIDLLFNNSGITGPNGPADEIDFDAWDACVAVNLTGTMLCTSAAVRQMKRQQPQGGRIINNGSISSMVPRPGSSAYSATKHAIAGLTKCTDLDGRGFGITCGQIDIGNTATDMTSGMSDGSLQADGSLKPEPTFPVAEAARTIVWMASLPPSATPNRIVVTASGMPYIGRG